MGRHELLRIYKEENCKKLCSPKIQKQSANVYTTNLCRLSLQEYIFVRSIHCNTEHMQPCRECTAMLSIAKTVASDGYCRLSVSFKNAFPTLSYKADIARERVLQMPLACIRLGSPEKGTSSWFFVEYVEGVNYQKFACFAEALDCSESSSTPAIHRAEVKALLGLAQSDRERELIRYSVFKASGVSSTTARKSFGFEQMNHRAKCVESALEEARCIHEAVEDLARTQDKALLLAMGFIWADSESESVSDCMSDDPLTPNGTAPHPSGNPTGTAPSRVATPLTSPPNREMTTREMTSPPNREMTTREMTSPLNREMTTREMTSPPNREMTTREMTSPPNREMTTREMTSPPNREMTPREMTSPPNREMTTREMTSAPNREMTTREMTSPPNREMLIMAHLMICHLLT